MINSIRGKRRLIRFSSRIAASFSQSCLLGFCSWFSMNSTPMGKEIVFVRGQYPVLDWKHRTFKTKEFRESRALGKYEGIGEDLTGMHFSNEKEISHLKEEADENEIPVQIYKPDMLDIFKMDIDFFIIINIFK